MIPDIAISVISALILALLTYSARKITQMYESQKVVADDVKGLKETNLIQSENLLAHCETIGYHTEAIRGLAACLKAMGANGTTQAAFDAVDKAKQSMEQQDRRNKKKVMGVA